MSQIDPSADSVPMLPSPSSVSDLLAQVARTLYDHLPDEVWVAGTITSWRPFRWRTFFELAEIRRGHDHPQARLGVVAHRRTADVIIDAAGVAPTDTPVHLDVAVGGRVTVDRRGGLELRVVAVRPLVTVSDVELDRRERLGRLIKSGRMFRQRALTLAEEPSRVGLVTPVSGEAARADVLSRLPAGMAVVERRVVMEGPEAAAAIARAVDGLSSVGLDLVVVARGGGSAAELAPFNADVVAAAIARAPVPVVIAVGHSTDRTLADDIAWRSLPTPMAASDWLADLDRARATQEIVETAWRERAAATAAQDAARYSWAAAHRLGTRYRQLRHRLIVLMALGAIAAGLIAIMAALVAR